MAKKIKRPNTPTKLFPKKTVELSLQISLEFVDTTMGLL